MQIYKATRVQTGGQSPRAQETDLPTDPETRERVEDFFKSDADSAESIPEVNPFDLMFASAPQADGGPETQGPSARQFAPSNVVTLENWLIGFPDGRYGLDKYIQKMESVRDNKFIKRKKRLEEALQRGGMSASETGAVQEKIKELDQAIAKINQEIEKARQFQLSQKENFFQEQLHMKDLNGDGYIGNPRDPQQNFYIVAKTPNGQEVILDHRKRVAVDPFIDPEYKPALANTQNLTLLQRADPASLSADEKRFHEELQITEPSSQGFPESTFGAQIDISAPEGFWVEKDPATGQPIYDRKALNGNGSYIPKKLEPITREDGKVMIGQKPPTPEERENYVFVRVTDFVLRTEKINDSTDEGHVILEFKGFQNSVEKTIMSIRVNGIETNANTPLKRAGSNYVAASSVGVAVNAGTGKHSSRVRPINVDASRFQSTGKVLQGTSPEEIQKFYDQLGISHDHHDGMGNFTKVNANDAGKETADGTRGAQRGRNAANYTIRNGFLSARPQKIDEEHKEKTEELARIFQSPNGSSVNSRQAYLPSELHEYKTGIFVTGIRGVITGTNYNDIIVTPEPNSEEIKKLLPIGASEIQNNDPAWGTVVKGGEGRNIVVSKGGDLFAEGVSFLWREDKLGREDQIQIITNNGETQDNKVNANQAIFIHIDGNPKIVSIDNKNDPKVRGGTGEDQSEGVSDDWYEVPVTAQFTNKEANDLPMESGPHANQATAETIQSAITEADTKINEKSIHLNPLSTAEGMDPTQWETYGRLTEEWDKQADSFFSAWEFFNPTKDDEGF